ncbi:MAG: hypothetical protein AB7U82_15030 [Blastocatellales bacterium]
MAHSLTFNLRHQYSSLENGIYVQTVLVYGDKTAFCRAKIDTGSEVCLFQRDLADMLSIEVESGYRKEFSTLTSGGLIAYGHSVTLQTLGLEFDAFVYFAAEHGLPRNILGREGWLQNVRLAVVDYDAEIYLSPY